MKRWWRKLLEVALAVLIILVAFCLTIMLGSGCAYTTIEIKEPPAGAVHINVYQDVRVDPQVPIDAKLGELQLKPGENNGISGNIPQKDAKLQLQEFP